MLILIWNYFDPISRYEIIVNLQRRNANIFRLYKNEFRFQLANDVIVTLVSVIQRFLVQTMQVVKCLQHLTFHAHNCVIIRQYSDDSMHAKSRCKIRR